MVPPLSTDVNCRYSWIRATPMTPFGKVDSLQQGDCEIVARGTSALSLSILRENWVGVIGGSTAEVALGGGWQKSCSGLSSSEARSSTRSCWFMLLLRWRIVGTLRIYVGSNGSFGCRMDVGKGWLLWWVGGAHGGCLIADFSWKLVWAQVCIHLSLSFWTAPHSPTPTIFP